MIILSILTITPAYSQVLIKYNESFNEYIVQTYLNKIVLDKSHGGIVKSYTYNDLEVTNIRYFGPGSTFNAIFYEIVPPPSPTGKIAPEWWPGRVLSSRVSFKVVENTSYKLAIETSMGISAIYDVDFVKKYIFYYDKPYFDIEYTIINNEDKELKMDLSNDWLRKVSFSVEIASSFGGDPGDDFQIYATTDGKFDVQQNYSPGKPDVAPGKILFIALVSHPSDYSIPQGIIVFPLGDTVKYTFDVWREQAGSGVQGVPVSSVVRIEMKDLTLSPKSNINFTFRVYIGPLISFVLQDLGIPRLITEVLKRGVRIPTELKEYRQPPYNVKININPSGEIYYPNATLYIYKVGVDDSLKYVDSLPVESTYIKLEEPGIYRFEVKPTYGFTRGKKYVYTSIYIEGSNGVADIPVFMDKTINISITLQPIAWVEFVFIDENDYPLKDIENNPVSFTFKDVKTGRVFIYNVSSQNYRIYVPLGSYKVTVEPRVIGERRLSDIYFNERYVLFMSTFNKVSFDIDLDKPASNNIIVIRYVSTKPVHSNNINMFMVLVFAMVLITAIVVWIMYTAMRGRRL